MVIVRKVGNCDGIRSGSIITHVTNERGVTHSNRRNIRSQGLPREVYIMLGHETWDFMMKQLRSRKTPIAKGNLPPPPDDILGSGNTYGISLN